MIQERQQQQQQQQRQISVAWLCYYFASLLLFFFFLLLLTCTVNWQYYCGIVNLHQYNLDFRIINRTLNRLVPKNKHEISTTLSLFLSKVTSSSSMNANKQVETQTQQQKRQLQKEDHTVHDNKNEQQERQNQHQQRQIQDSQTKNRTNNNIDIILVMGLPRSGSESIHNYFTCNSIPSSHYCCYTSKKRNPSSNPTSTSTSNTTTTTIVTEQQQRTRFPCANTNTNTNTNTNNTNDHFSIIPCGQCVFNNVQIMQRQYRQYQKQQKQKQQQQRRRHYKTKRKTHRRRPFDGCDNYIHKDKQQQHNLHVYSQFDVETGVPYSWFLPQHYLLPILYESYKGRSIWILNYRSSPILWADNVLHWYSTTKRILQSFNIEYYKYVVDDTVRVDGPQYKNLSFDTLLVALEKSYHRSYSIQEHKRRRNQLIRIYTNHLLSIRQFAIHYNQSLIEINVDETITTNQQLLDTSFQSILLQQHQQHQHKEQGHYTTNNDNYNNNKNCWSFDSNALDNDWTDFSYS